MEAHILSGYLKLAEVNSNKILYVFVKKGKQEFIAGQKKDKVGWIELQITT